MRNENPRHSNRCRGFCFIKVYPITPAKQAAGKKAAAKTGAIKKPAAKKPRVSAKAEPATVALDEYGRLALEMTASKGWNTARLEREALRRDALILPTDRTPVDVVWRRTRSLLNHLRAMPGAPNLAAETAALGALAPEVAALQKEAAPAETQARALFTRITSLRRRIAFKNPLLDFSQIDRTVVVYANTSAAVKARADWLVTSSCALEIVQALKDKGHKILWAPDRHLGGYIQRETGADMLMWNGSCIVHDEFKAFELEGLMREHPQAKVLVHPELMQ